MWNKSTRILPFIGAKDYLLLIVFLSTGLACMGQIDQADAGRLARSMEVRTGLTSFSSREAGMAPFIGVGVQTMKNGWIFAAELTHHWEHVRRRQYGDPVPVRNSSIVNALVGRQFAFELIKYNLTTGLGLLSERQPIPDSGLVAGPRYTRQMGVSWPVRLDVVFARRPFGAGLFVFSNVNTETSMFGGGIIIPLVVRPKF